MNTLGIDNHLDWPRIRHLFQIGIFAGLAALSADIVLGWGVPQEGISGADGYLSRYLTVSDGRIFASALLGIIGIPTECLSYAGIYRLMADSSAKHAHAYRAGLFGMLIFGALTHVMCCAAVFYYRRIYAIDPGMAAADTIRFAIWFLIPAAVLFAISLFTTAFVQISAFAQGKTPYPKRCWMFSILAGFVFMAVMRLIGNHPLTNALSTGWISLGSLWMLSGLLMTMKHGQKGRK